MTVGRSMKDFLSKREREIADLAYRQAQDELMAKLIDHWVYVRRVPSQDLNQTGRRLYRGVNRMLGLDETDGNYGKDPVKR